MKRITLLCLFLICCLCMNGFIIAPEKAEDEKSLSVSAPMPDQNMIEEARIEHLLNINNVYGDSFTDNEALVNCAAAFLRSYADQNGFIAESIITEHIKALYDIDLIITDDINSDMPKKDGSVYLIPRGYTVYSHEITSMENDGEDIIVLSEVTAITHDGSSIKGTATSVLSKNDNSSFGYNIINSYIQYIA